MRVYQDWGLCSGGEERRLLMLADRIYRRQHPQEAKNNRTTDKAGGDDQCQE